MNILVVNDDGINAKGLSELVKALSEKGSVYVCAPDSERSGSSRSITLGETIKIEHCHFDGAREGIVTTGTPVDCTKAGLEFFAHKGIKFDMVFGGVNLGGNLGRDIHYSSTVGVVIEAALEGYPAVAVSVDSHSPGYYDTACLWAKKMVDYIAEFGLPEGKYLNINVPDLPSEEIRGSRITRIGGRHYDDSFYLQENGEYLLDGDTVIDDDDGDDTDTVSIANHYVSITPVTCDETAYDIMENLEALVE